VTPIVILCTDSTQKSILDRRYCKDDAFTASTDAVLETRETIGEDSALAVYQREQRWMDEVKDLVIGPRMPILSSEWDILE
jgi:hypothetical protein